MIFQHLGRMVKKKGLPLHLIYQCTYRCNSKCRSCFLQDQMGSADPRSELRLDELAKISRAFKNLLWLQIGGGEPFLRDDIAEICRLFNKTDTISIATNCVRPQLVEEKVRQVLKDIDSRLLLVLSLDGIGSDHDEIRGVKGNFESVIETYQRLSGLRDTNKNFIMSVNTVIMPENMPKLSRIVGYVRQNFRLNMHSMEFLRDSPAARNPSPMRIGPRELSAASSLIRRNIIFYNYGRGWRSRVLKRVKLYENSVIVNTLRHKKKQLPCYAGMLSAVIDPYGDVFACELIDEKIGNVRDYGYDFKKIWRSNKADDIRRRIRDCFCTHSCFYLLNLLFNPLALARALLKDA